MLKQFVSVENKLLDLLELLSISELFNHVIVFYHHAVTNFRTPILFQKRLATLTVRWSDVKQIVQLFILSSVKDCPIV